MKILHIWNTAGVGSILAKYQAKLLGWKTWVVMRRRFDKFGLTIYGASWRVSARVFHWLSCLKAWRYDLVHVHALDSLVPYLKKLYPEKPVVLHYHGTDIRGKWRDRRKYWEKADALIVATPDLLEGAPDHAVYLPNPVDTELFRPMPELRRPGTAVYMYDETPKYHASLLWAKKVAEKRGLRLTIHHRGQDPIRYTDLPIFLNKFEYFIDHNWVPSLSKTALEALACGLKVVRWDDRVVEGLSSEHRPDNVVRRLRRVYEPLVNS